MGGFRRDRRRYVSPGGVMLFVIVIVFFSIGFAKVQSVQTDFRSNALVGCGRVNVQNTALLDLGKIITAARSQTSTSPRVRKAATDFIVQAYKFPVRSAQGAAFRDLAVLLGGDKGTPADSRDIALLEDDFIKNARKIEQPRDCQAAYG